MRAAIPILGLLLVAFPLIGHGQSPSVVSTETTTDGERLGNSVFLIETEIDRRNDHSQILKRREFQLKSAQARLESEVKKLPDVKTELDRLTKSFSDLMRSFADIDPKTVESVDIDTQNDPEGSSTPNRVGGSAEPRLAPGQPTPPQGGTLNPVPPNDAAQPAPPPTANSTTRRGSNDTYFCAAFQGTQNSLEKLRKIESDARSLRGDIYEQESKLSQIDDQAEAISSFVTVMLAREIGLEMLQERSPESGMEASWRPASVYEQVKSLLSDIDDQLRGLDRYRREVEQNCENLKAWIVGLLTTTGEELRTVERERSQYERDLSEAYQKASEQAGIDGLLNWAIIFMIIAMVALYCSLLTFRKDLADAIIEERTLLEVLSMGFLMLTVIILGTGKFLSIESLAALLGTIAGYIFGRRIEGEDDDE